MGINHTTGVGGPYVLHSGPNLPQILTHHVLWFGLTAAFKFQVWLSCAVGGVQQRMGSYQTDAFVFPTWPMAQFRTS